MSKLKDLMTANKEALTKAFAGVMTFEELVRNVMTGSAGKKIDECTVASILGALFDAASLKMRPFGYNGVGYLIPSRRFQAWECRFDPGYKGLLDLAKRIPELVVKTPQVVYSNDRCELDLGSSTVRHVPANDNRGDIVSAYVVWHYRGVQDLEFIGKEEIEKIRDCSKAQKPDSPWNQWGGPMTAKSVVRRAAKNWPATQELGYAVALSYAVDEPDAAKNLEVLGAPQSSPVVANAPVKYTSEADYYNAPVDAVGKEIPVVTVKPARDFDVEEAVQTILMMTPELAAGAIVGLFGLHPAMVGSIVEACLPAAARKFGKKGALPIFTKVIEARPDYRLMLEGIWKSLKEPAKPPRVDYNDAESWDRSL